MLRSYFLNYAETYSPYKGGPVCYEDGLLYFALVQLFQATGDQVWLDHAKRIASDQIDDQGNMASYVVEEYNIDNVFSGRAFLFLAKEFGEAKYRKAIDTMAKQLESHPRTKGGNYWHKKRYPYQVWLDGLWMGLPFQIEYAQLTDDEVMLQDALDQLMRALVLLEVPQTRLYAHGYDEAREQPWANKETGHNEAHWGRALGWLAMALIEVIDLANISAESEVSKRLVALLDRMLELQCESGAWLQVVDQPELPGNYEETSGTAMFAYALMKASRFGLGDHFAAPGIKALKHLEELVLNSDADKPVMPQICCVAGLGGFEGNYRDGTAHYYTTEELRDDDIKGVSPLMLASAEYYILEKIDQTKGAAVAGA